MAGGEPIGDAPDLARLACGRDGREPSFCRTRSRSPLCDKPAPASTPASNRSSWPGLQRHQPEAAGGKAAHALHCKDWLYFKLTGRRAVDPAEGIFTYGDFRTGSYARPFVSERLGIGASCPSSPRHPSTGARPRHHGPRRSPPRPRPGCRADCQWCSVYVDVVCSAIGGGPVRRFGHDRMLHFSARTGNAHADGPTAPMASCPQCGLPPDTPWRLPGPGPVRADPVQTWRRRSTSTGLVELARQGLRHRPESKSHRHALLAGVEAQCRRRRQPGSSLYHPYILQAGERGPVYERPMRGAQFTGLSTNTTFAGLFRSIYEGPRLCRPRLLRRDGEYSE